jgi:RNA-directed DNA polymerase
LPFCVAAQLRPAYLWLIGARAKASPNADIWDLRRNWPQLRQSLKKQITTGTYIFAPLQRVRDVTGPAYSWSAQDALVLKALTLALADILPTHDSCTHVAGHGGLKRERPRP